MTSTQTLTDRETDALTLLLTAAEHAGLTGARDLTWIAGGAL